MDDLLKSALVGTATLPVSLETAHPADALLDGLPSDPERLLLLKAGVRSIWRQAGYEPRRDVPPLTPAPLETAPALSEKATAALLAALTGNARELLPEFLERLAAAERRLPPELLPDALSPVARSREIRNLIRPVLGERGRWLARLNPDWSWAAGEDVASADEATLLRIWDEGSIAERTETLIRLREIDPENARSRLAEVFGKEKADVRARFLEGMATRLSTQDEPFLEDTLGDRSESVRTVAAGLLARLPDSRLVARMTERSDGLLAAERSGLLKRKLKLIATPPQSIEKEWLRDGVPKEARTGSGVGNRSAWLEAVLGTVPLEHWTRRFDATPQELIVAAEANDFGDAILRGWTQSSLRSPAGEPDSAGSSAWRRPLADFWADRAAAAIGKKADHQALSAAVGHLRNLLVQLAASDADQLLRPLLEQSRRSDLHRVGTPVLDLLRELPRPWSVELSRLYLRAVTPALAQKQPSGYWWANTLPSAAAALAIEIIDEALETVVLPVQDEASPYQNAVNQFHDLLRLRRDFFRELSL